MDGNPKQSIVERVKNATNILVTVSRNPSVDELAAALGFTLMLNKMDKHATAVFSGAIPSAINFLEPSKTFESTVDSLRDFIIALDKEKADRLRYKVEDDVVRIFITPYRTTITSADLDFSQGDFNVELIVALGVEKKDDLDAAITAHGRILHDATVVTINAKNEKSSLGTIDWSDGNASSLCEMLMSLSEALQPGLLDQQIASSLLTGIVASTERFSNPRTSPKVMTMAAQLMAAGANQQLIAAKLEEGDALSSVKKVENDGTTRLKEGGSEKLQAEQDTPTADVLEKKASKDGEMTISHGDETHDESTALPPPMNIDQALAAPNPFVDVSQPQQVNHDDDLSAQISSSSSSTVSVSDMQKDLEDAHREVEEAASQPTPQTLIGKVKTSDWRGKIMQPPSMGGTLSSTASDAEAAKLEEERSSRNHTILSHDGPGAGAVSVSGPSDEPPTIDPFAQPMSYEETPVTGFTPSKPLTIMPLPTTDTHEDVPQSAMAPSVPTLAELEAQAHAHADSTPEVASTLDDARAAVDAALSSLAMPAGNLDQPLPVDPQLQQQQAPLSPPVDTALPSLPPMPDFTTLPPLPPAIVEEPPQAIRINPQFPLQPEPVKTDPGQFRIPGQ